MARAHRPNEVNMRTVLATVIAAMAASLAHAQEVGQTTEQFLAHRPDAQIVPVINGSPGAAIAWGDTWQVRLCDGVVVAESYRFGNTLEAFADEVEKETQRRGTPEFEARHGRSSSGEWGVLSASWTQDELVTVIGLSSSARGMLATRSTTAPSSPCFAVLAP
jgi:hypothetical protein